jgi:hypothetical protein
MLKALKSLVYPPRNYWILVSNLGMDLTKCLMEPFNAAKKRVFSSSNSGQIALGNWVGIELEQW